MKYIVQENMNYVHLTKTYQNIRLHLVPNQKPQIYKFDKHCTNEKHAYACHGRNPNNQPSRISNEMIPTNRTINQVM